LIEVAGSRFDSDEETLARLLAALPPAPAAWVEAAAALPRTRRDADRIVALVEADQEFRRTAGADLETALRRAGYEPTQALLAAIRERLGRPG
jgi:hypothetical protein